MKFIDLFSKAGVFTILMESVAPLPVKAVVEVPEQDYMLSGLIKAETIPKL